MIGTAMAMLAIAACGRTSVGAPLYGLDQCRHVALTDAATGKPVIGAEDLAYDAASRRVLISAYDRRRVERAAGAGADALSEGGVYAVSLDLLKGDASTLDVASVVSRDSVAGGLRPHGVYFDAARREITFVNRAYFRDGKRWRMAPRIERMGAEGAIIIGDNRAPRCSANDVAVVGERTFVSFDHAGCGWRAGIEEIFNARGSGVDLFNGARVFKGARHANGIVATADGRLALAATRDRAVLILAPEGDALIREKKIPTPGAPDNVTINSDGAIIAALYPSLGAIGAQRKFGIGRSASRVVRIDIDRGASALLFDDPKAALISAASAAIEEEGTLIIGSALDRGVAVCERDAARR